MSVTEEDIKNWRLHYLSVPYEQMTGADFFILLCLDTIETMSEELDALRTKNTGAGAGGGSEMKRPCEHCGMPANRGARLCKSCYDDGVQLRNETRHNDWPTDYFVRGENWGAATRLQKGEVVAMMRLGYFEAGDMLRMVSGSEWMEAINVAIA